MKKNDSSSVWNLVTEGKKHLSESELKDLELSIDKKLSMCDIDDITDELAFRSALRKSKKKRRILKNIRIGVLVAVSIIAVATAVRISIDKLTTLQVEHATQTNVAFMSTLVENANRMTATAIAQVAMAPTVTDTPTEALPGAPNPVSTPLAETQRIDFYGELSKKFCDLDRKICFIQGLPELSDGTYAVFTNLTELELPCDGKIPLNLAVANEPDSEALNVVTNEPDVQYLDLRNCDVSEIANPCFLGVVEYGRDQQTGRSFVIRYKEQIPTNLLNGRLFSLIRLPDPLKNFIININSFSGEIVTLLLPLEQVKNTAEIAVDCSTDLCDEKLLDHFKTNESLTLGVYNLSFFTQNEIDITKSRLQLYRSDANGNRNLILDSPFTEISNQYGLISLNLTGEYEIQLVDEMNHLLNLEDSYLLVWR